MYKVRRNELCEERRHDVGEEDDAFGDGGADEVLGRGEDDHVENIIYKAWLRYMVLLVKRAHVTSWENKRAHRIAKML